MYEFTVKDIRGNDVPMSNYRYAKYPFLRKQQLILYEICSVFIFGFFSGKVLLIVNLSPKCELMDIAIQELNFLHKKYFSQGLEILAFPAHLFMSQVNIIEQ